MSYTIDATNPLEPTDAEIAKFGAAELRAIKAYIQTTIVPRLLASATLPRTVPPGTIIPYLGTSAPAGWILVPGNLTSDFPAIGNAASGATVYAAADAADLYAVLWQNPASIAYTSGGTQTAKGASAAADFAALKNLSIPQIGGRTPFIPDTAGSKLSNTKIGSDTVTIAAANLPDHTHDLTGVNISDATGIYYQGTGPTATKFGGATGTVVEAHGQAMTVIPKGFVFNWLIAK